MSYESDTSIIYNEEYDSDNSVSKSINNYVNAYIKNSSYNKGCVSNHNFFKNSYDNYNGLNLLENSCRNNRIYSNYSTSSGTDIISTNTSKCNSKNNSYENNNGFYHMEKNFHKNTKISSLKKKITKLNYKFVLQEIEYNENKKKHFSIQKNFFKFNYNMVLKELLNNYNKNIMYKKIYNSVISEINKRDIYINGIMYKKFLNSL